MLLLNPTFLPVDAYREEAHLADAVGRLATGRRVVAFDRSGLGLSDPVAPDAPPSVAQWAPTRSPCSMRRAWIAPTCWPTPTPG